VGKLSNFLRRTDAPAGPRTPVLYRPAGHEQVHPGLRLILGSDGRLADEAMVVDFLQFAMQRGIDLNDLWVADQGGRVTWAVLPIVSPGRTMLILAPGGRPRGERGDEVARALVEAVCEHCLARGVALAQVLLDPADAAARGVYLGGSFRQMAELLYLQADVRRTYPAPPPPEGFRWVTYTPAEHARFAATISASYRESLDCPALNGVRDIEDVMAGHKASGDFDPAWWFLLCDREEPRAVLLLSRTPPTGTAELVYLGLVPAARGSGLGDLVMRQALHQVAAHGPGRLALAVDAGNAPALRLYHRHGLRKIGSKLAMMRELRTSAVEPAPPPQIAI
jgi:mycothiol synthase